MGARPGWYPDANGMQRWYDGRQWTPHTATPERIDHTRMWVITAVCVTIALAGVVIAAWYVNRPVSSMTSNNPRIEAFYDELEQHGLGDMKAIQAMDWAQEACEGNGLVLWGRGDYSMAESFDFATAALKVCDDL